MGCALPMEGALRVEGANVEGADGGGADVGGTDVGGALLMENGRDVHGSEGATSSIVGAGLARINTYINH